MPTLLTSIMSHPDAEKTKPAFRSIKLCFFGAAPLLPETRRRFEELTGGVVVSATGNDLKAFCKERLAPCKVPVQVTIVAELPKSPIGKVLRRKLRELG